MLADIRTIFQSDVYRVIRYQCHCDICSVSNAEYNDSFCFSFIQTGYFEYSTFRRKDDVHTGRILISKPDFPHITRHVDGQPDITTTFEFSPALLMEMAAQYARTIGWFLHNKDLHSVVISSDAVLDHLHHLFNQTVRAQADKLTVDELVMEILDRLLQKMGNNAGKQSTIRAAKHFHLPMVEQAQAYLLAHYREDLSLQQLATHCHTSVFHFSRLFKNILHTTPHQYLLGIRLHAAQRLLENTEQPVSAIAFDCGFSSVEYFATAYKKQYGVSPSAARKLIV